MIIPQNGVFVAQFRIFYFTERSCSDLEIFNFLDFKLFHRFKKCDVMMGNSTQDRVHFLVQFLLHFVSLGHDSHPAN